MSAGRSRGGSGRSSPPEKRVMIACEHEALRAVLAFEAAQLGYSPVLIPNFPVLAGGGFAGFSREDLTLACGPVELDLVRLRATAGGNRMDLARAQWLILSCLILESGSVVSRAVLSGFAELDAGSNFKRLHGEVRKLRERLDEALPGTGALLESVRGVGYRLASGS